MLNFLDLFLPKPLASPDRGRAFLWMIYHYLESSEPPNPFDIPHAHQVPGKAPYIRPLTQAEMMKENVDTPEELEWGKRMSAQRNVFLQKLVTSMESEKKTKPAAPHFVTGIYPFLILYDRVSHLFSQLLQPPILPPLEHAQADDSKSLQRKMVLSCIMCQAKTHLSLLVKVTLDAPTIAQNLPPSRLILQ